jgi:hypothetical protein
MNRNTAFLLVPATFSALIVCLYAIELHANGNLITWGWSAFLLAPVPIAYAVLMLVSGAARAPY